MEISLHDNRVVSYSVNSENKEIRLQTAYEDGERVEHIEVLFEGVFAYHFQLDDLGTIIFDIEECDPEVILKGHVDLFKLGEKYAWPRQWDPKSGSVLAHLQKYDIRAFEISSSTSMSGWVFARNMKKRISGVSAN